jgi:hypothetical protein
MSGIRSHNVSGDRHKIASTAAPLSFKIKYFGI